MLSITNLKARLNTDRLEDGAMFNGPNIDVKGADQRNGNGLKWFSVPPAYYIKLHMHQDKWYSTDDLPPGSAPILTDSNPVYSPQDIFNFMKLFSYTGSINTTDMLVSRLGTFAMMINDADKATSAYNLLNENEGENAIALKFMDDYKKIIGTDIGIDSDEEKAQGIVKFINTVKVNGKPLGISLYKATYDTNGQITNWTNTQNL